MDRSPGSVKNCSRFGIVSSMSVFMIISLWISKQSIASATTSHPTFKHVKILNVQDLEEQKKSEFLSVVYFYVKDLPSTKTFLGEFEESAKVLNDYHVTLGVFFCKEANLKTNEKCKENGVEKNVYTYQNGVELIPLELETMFDRDSIISNSLQLALLQEVPIVQTRLERQEIERSNAASHDLIFAYSEAVGTREHRIFIEIAYIFQDRYKFAVTTEFKSTSGLQDSEIQKPSTRFVLWTLFCSESTTEEVAEEGGCQSVLYKGETSLSDIASYVDRLSHKTVYHAPRDGTTHLFLLDKSIPVIYMYSKDKDEKFEEILDILANDARGFANVVVVDMNDAECKSEATKQGLEGELPALSIKTVGDGITFMDLFQEWKISSIENFLHPYIFPKRSSQEKDLFEMASSDDDSNLIQKVETQDDQVAKAVFSNHGNELHSVEVPSLLKSSFDGATKSSEIKLVLFYLPFDAIGMAFLLDFDQAWKALAVEYPDRDLLARVNCFDATDLCTIQNITTYPLLRIYQKGKNPQHYEGPLDTKSVIRAVKLLMLNGPIVLQTEEEVEGFFNGEFPQNMSELISTSVLFVSRTKDEDTMDILDLVSKQLLVFDLLGTVKENLLEFISDKYGAMAPSVVCFNRKDAIQPIRILDTLEDASTIVDFVKLAAIPTMPELGVENFPPLFSLHKPFVIVFMDPSDAVSNDAKNVVTQAAPMFTNAIFCWMDAQMKSIGIRLLSEYTWTATLPLVTVVDHSQGKVFNYHTKPVIEEDVTDWLKNVFSGKEEPSKLLLGKKWEAPGKHYDFLAMIDEEKENMRKNENMKVENEGFDETLKRAQERMESGTEDNEYLKIENEIREELLELRKSRLYRHSEHQLKKVILEEEEEGKVDQKNKADHFIHDHAEL